MKRMQGACLRAIANISRTLEGPTPTNISKNSDPDTVMKGTLASPAVALASKVLPVPGGPPPRLPLLLELLNMFMFHLSCDDDGLGDGCAPFEGAGGASFSSGVLGFLLEPGWKYFSNPLGGLLQNSYHWFKTESIAGTPTV
ncbi:hypothetical protein SFRURICE_008013 [Spodoptera frugiperda]|uniref:SFRICE_001600 n=1 Tax=Spodoptera frugiperda TaxID=7108 RepID=A0A2H1WV60_SPOFR|nr:hypothetical protein SFRURICE_008013 [Spodoptera frugiperda]